MAKKKVDEKQVKSPPASTPEARENQMIALAVDLAEKQLREGTASPSVITHYLKLGSTREALEKEMLSKKTELVSAQKETLESTKHIEELYSQAIEAMRLYSGADDLEE